MFERNQEKDHGDIKQNQQCVTIAQSSVLRIKKICLLDTTLGNELKIGV